MNISNIKKAKTAMLEILSNSEAEPKDKIKAAKVLLELETQEENDKWNPASKQE
ncbi:MAG: hypothetical protein J6C34_09185 [Oscillospiraceae bacterium]|nr:hypothetical protein [Oscillospiraceae bacterium]